jgi:hypothetical protein
VPFLYHGPAYLVFLVYREHHEINKLRGFNTGKRFKSTPRNQLHQQVTRNLDFRLWSEMVQ